MIVREVETRLVPSSHTMKSLSALRPGPSLGALLKRPVMIEDSTVKPVPLTIEGALAAVAREFNLVFTALSGSLEREGRVVVEAQDGSGRAFVVVTRAEEEKQCMTDILESIQADGILDDMSDLDSKVIYEALSKHADLADLGPWLVAETREEIRSLAQHGDPRFWEMWQESGLKPLATNVRKEVIPAFDLVKALQRYMVQDLSNPGQRLLELLDHDYEHACDIILEQCNVDIPSLAVTLLASSGGVEGVSDGLFTPEGFIIEVRRRRRT